MDGERTLVRVGKADLYRPIEIDVLAVFRIKYLSKNGPYRVHMDTGHKQKSLQVSSVHEAARFS